MLTTIFKRGECFANPGTYVAALAKVSGGRNPSAWEELRVNSKQGEKLSAMRERYLEQQSTGSLKIVKEFDEEDRKRFAKEAGVVARKKRIAKSASEAAAEATSSE